MFETELTDFIQKAIVNIGDEVISYFDSKLHTEVTNRKVIDMHGDCGIKFCVKQNLDGSNLYADVTIHFTHIGSCSSNEGFFVELIGECTDGTNTYTNDIRECPDGLLNKADYKDFIDLIENYDPVEFSEKVINLFCDNLRADLADMAA